MRLNLCIRMLVLAVVMTPLYGLLATRQPFPQSETSLWLYAASCVIVAHVSLGAYILMRFLQTALTPTHLAIDVILIVLLYATPWTVADLFLWSTGYALFFALVLGKYRLLRGEVRGPSERAYIDLKIRNEWPAVVFFAAVAVLTAFFPNAPHFQHALGVVSFLLAVAFLLWLAIVKKAYHWALRPLPRG